MNPLGHVGFFLFTLAVMGLMGTSYFAAYLDQPSACVSVPPNDGRYILQAGPPGNYHLYLYRQTHQIDQVIKRPVLFIPGHAGSFRQVQTIATLATDLDIFTVDLHEELTALDGQGVLHQAHYINQVIQTFPPSEGVIILAHSMGGIVARAALTLPNYIPGSIQTLVTFSTPHAHPPVPIDPHLNALYHTIHTTTNSSVDIVSIVGGARDITIHSDLAYVNPGSTHFTTSIPHLWTSLGHNEILTCSPLIKRIVSALEQRVDLVRALTTSDLDQSHNTIESVDGWKTTLGGSMDSVRRIYANKTLVALDDHKKGWTILTETDQVTVALCRTTLECQPVTRALLPNNNTFVRLDPIDLGEYDTLALDHGIVWLDSFSLENTTRDIDTLGIAWFGADIHLSRSLYSRIQLPSHPILAYRLTTTTTSAPDQEFPPFLRYSIQSMYESRFVMDLTRPAHLIVHGSDESLWLDVWHTHPLKITLTLDWYFIMGRITQRYGILVVPFCFSVVLLVMAGQTLCYHRTGVFPSFSDGLGLFYRRTLPISLIGVFLVNGWVWVMALVLCTGVISGLGLLTDGLLRSGLPGFIPPTWFLIVLLFMAILIPPSLAILVFVLLHVQTCLRAYKKSRRDLGMNTYHYMHTVLLQLITVLPLHLPFIAVWVRDDQVIGGWVGSIPVVLYLARLASYPRLPLPPPPYYSVIIPFILFFATDLSLLPILTSTLYTTCFIMELCSTLCNKV